MSDAKSKAVAAASAKTKTIKFVLIPCDESLPTKEDTITFALDNEVGAMGEHVRAHFNSAKLNAESAAKLKDSLREQIKSKVGGGAAITDQFLSQFASMSPFDMLPLLQHGKATQFEGVNMYVDDQAIAKGLSSNRRASSITIACGRPTNVMGDAFVARVMDDDKDYFERKDFTLADIAPDAEWVKRAQAQSAAKAAQSRVDTTEQIAGLLTSAKKNKPKDCTRGGCANMGLNRCSRCRAAYYCTVECQTKDWERHKPNCHKPKAAAGGKPKPKPAAAAATAAATTTDTEATATAAAAKK